MGLTDVGILTSMQRRQDPSQRFPWTQRHASDFDREEAELWKQVDPKMCIHPEHLPRTHRLAVVWLLYHMLHLAKDVFDQTLPEFTKALGLFIGVGVRTGLNLTIKAGMHALASEEDRFLPRVVHLWFANMPPDIARQANGVLKFLRTEASALQSTKNVQERLTTLVRGFDALFHKLDLEENDTGQALRQMHNPPPYQMPPAVHALWHAILEHQQIRLREDKQRKRAARPSPAVQNVTFADTQGDAYAPRSSHSRRKPPRRAQLQRRMPP
jgi:hypothetical protein